MSSRDTAGSQRRRAGRIPRSRFGAALLIAATVAAGGGAASAASRTSKSTLPIAACGLGSRVRGIGGGESSAVARAAAAYGAGLHGDSAAARRSGARTFAAALSAYLYGMPQEILLKTLKGYVRNEIVNVNALATPSTQGVVSPNVDTAYSVAWIDLTDGPLVFNVPDTGGHYYTAQFMDAYTNAFAYVGAGSTGTKAGAFAIVPPGWHGTLPHGVSEIKSPTNTVWLLARTLVDGPSDFPAVKKIQEGFKLTSLAAWTAGVREPSVTISSYPSGKKKALPTGTAFISTLNQELTIDPPPAADDCAVRAMSTAGVVLPHPTAAQSQAADLENIAGETPSSHDDAATTAAVDAGVAAGPGLVARLADRLESAVGRGRHGWAILNRSIGVYGTQYAARVIIATDFLGANTPAQGLYPLAYHDVDGRVLDGAHDYTITFPKGRLPPERAFWSLTMYDSDNYLYANSIDRYEIGNRTPGLVRGRGGSLTVYIQHAEPRSAARRASWLPAPSGVFHVVLRLYEPKRSALDETWIPPPIVARGERLSAWLERHPTSPSRRR